MSEQSGKRPRRRRGGRGGQGRPRDGAEQRPPAEAPDGAAPPGPTSRPDGRGPRQDTRGRARSERPPGAGGPAGQPPGPPGPGGRTHRSPSVTDRPRGGDRDRPRAGGDRPQRDGRRDGGSRDSGPRDRDRGGAPRVFEAPVPQDERSVELGAAFKESQLVMRDARKALAKRRAEFGDEPEWMLDQLAAAEERFEAAATSWTAHLETTGRKVVRADRR